MTEDNDDTKTEARTMWSETLLEALCIACDKQKDDATIKDILKDLLSKGYEKPYLISKVEKKIGPEAGDRLKSILGGGGSARKVSKKRAVRKKVVRKKTASKRRLVQQQEGFLARLMSFFKK